MEELVVGDLVEDLDLVPVDTVSVQTANIVKYINAVFHVMTGDVQSVVHLWRDHLSNMKKDKVKTYEK